MNFKLSLENKCGSINVFQSYIFSMSAHPCEISKGTFDRKYFKRIETVEFFQQHASTLEVKKEHPLEDLNVVVSSLLLNLKSQNCIFNY